MASTLPIDEWKALATYYRSALEKAEAHIKELEKPAAPVEVLLTMEEMEKRVIALERRTAYKADWKKVVTKEGLIGNISNILCECYDYLSDKEDSGVENAEEMGDTDTLKRQLFILKLISYLKEEGCFHDEDTRKFDSFEDTAGGCDETTQDAVIYLLKNPDWTPSN